MRVYRSMEELVGGTPLLEVCHYAKNEGLGARLLCKLEYLNPAGSVKDRAALGMLRAAQAEGKLTAESTIIEPTSGNTGIGLAAIAAAHGWRVILTMPDSMSSERRALLQAYGAELHLSEGAKGMQGAIALAEELHRQIPNSFIVGQFDNPANAQAHYESTAPEIWEDTEGKVDIFVAGVGSGGTISGVGRYLKEQNPKVQVVAVEPAGSPLLSGGKAGSHGLQGIGANFIPSLLDRSAYDSVMPVREQDAYVTAQKLAKQEGVLVGISSGAALWAATELARLPENQGKCIVVLLPDTGDRYLSTPLFEEVQQ